MWLLRPSEAVTGMDQKGKHKRERKPLGTRAGHVFWHLSAWSKCTLLTRNTVSGQLDRQLLLGVR